jgi:hypothetical protein
LSILACERKLNASGILVVDKRLGSRLAVDDVELYWLEWLMMIDGLYNRDQISAMRQKGMVFTGGVGSYCLAAILN